MTTILPTLSLFVEIYRTGHEETILKSAQRHIILPDEGEEMADEKKKKKKEVEWESFSAGITTTTSEKYVMIRFDMKGKAKDRATFVKNAGPQIKAAVNEIAEEFGLEPVFG